MQDPEPIPTGPRARYFNLVVLGLVCFCTGIELALQGADRGLWGSAIWRPLAYQNAGFWAGLLWGWRPNYALQPVTMFLSYSFLHAGLDHLAGNMLVLLALARRLRDRIGTLGFLALWAWATFAGAVSFALLSHSPQPMVGSSGALFGLAGMLVAVEARRHPGGLRRAGLVTAGLVVLNLVFWWLQKGGLAWEAHLGGFLAGLIWGWLRPGPYARRP